MVAIRWGKFKTLLIVFLALLAVTTEIFAQDNPSPLVITVEYTDGTGNPASPVQTAGEDITTVEITLDATEDVCPDAVSTRPIDAVLVIDVSGSMDDPTSEGISKLAATQQAAIAFTEQLRPGDQVALVAFSGSASVELELTDDIEAAQQAIQGLSTGGGTNIPSGIDAATDLLAGAGHNSEQDAIPVIIVLSDGQDNVSAVQNSADRARRLLDQTRIAAIGLGTDVSRDALTAAADEGLAFFTASSAELITFYERIVTLVQPRVNATNITITFTYDRSNYELQLGTLNPPGQLIGDQLIWTVAELNAEDDPQTFRFQVRSVDVGSAPVGSLTVNYIPCEETNFRGETILVPPLLTQAPTPTPIPSATVTPTATPTALPTATSLPVASLNQAPVNPVEAQSVSSTYCDTQTYNYIGLFLAFLLFIAILLFIIWRAIKYFDNATGERGRGFGGSLCFFMRWIPLLYLAALAFFIFPTVAEQSCEMPESVYHWRINGQSSGIFLTHPDNTGDVPQVESLNEFGCIGCHITNPETDRVAAIAGPPPGNILIIDDNGDSIEPSGSPSIEAVYIAFSPDGSRIVYSDANSDLYILDIASGTVAPLPSASDPTVAELMPTWTITPDGRELIAFVRAAPSNISSNGLVVNNESDIYILDLTSGQPAQPLVGASNDGLNFYPVFSPDGQWLSFTWHINGSSYSNNNADIFIIPATGGTRIRAAANEDEASDSWATWSEDSSQIAFQSDRNDPNHDIFVANVNADGTTGTASPLAGAAALGETELHAQWGAPVGRISLQEELAWLFPIPLVIFAVLLGAALLTCVLANLGVTEEVETEQATRRLPPVRPRIAVPNKLIRERRIGVLWEPQPTLIIGLGHTGRWVLTHLKKTLLDAGLGKIPEDVVLLCIAAGNTARLSDANNSSGYTFGGVELSAEEIIEWKDNLHDVISTADQDASLRGWIRSTYLNALGNFGKDPRNGFNNQRTLGRLAIINNLRGNKAETQIDLWQTLVEAAQRTTIKPTTRRLNVIIVTDTSDDIGSGSYIDLSYLMRRVKNELNLQGVHIIGHLITERAQPERAQQHQAEINTAASLRELNRFELSANIPAPMVYRQGQSQHQLDGMVNYRLFDEVYLYDGGGQKSILANRSSVNGIFPAVADSIALWMDAAARQRDLARSRSQKIGNAQQFTLRQHKLMVSSIGIYQFKLPFFDILTTITARFALNVLQLLLVGESRIQPTLRPELVIDPEFRDRDAVVIAQEFLQFKYNTPDNLPNNWFTLLTLMATSSDEKELTQSLKRVSNEKSEQILPALKQWIETFLNIILNGVTTDAQNPDWLALRSAKLSLAIAVLNELSYRQNATVGLLWQNIARLEALNDKANNTGLEILKEWAEYIKKSHDGLRLFSRWLGIGVQPKSLYEVLQNWANNLKQVEEQANNTITRSYIWQDHTGRDLADVWYETYMEPHILEGLSALGWEMSNGQQQLVVQMPTVENEDTPGEKIPYILDENASQEEIAAEVHNFAEKLLQMAQFFAARIPEDEDLHSILKNSYLSNANVVDTANRLLQNSEIALNHQRVPTSESGIILSANDNINTEQIEKEITRRLVHADLIKLNTTDPYTLTVIQTVDAVPISEINSVRLANQQYVQAMGLNTGGPPAGSIALSLFDAEQRALEYERGLRSKLSQQARFLDPSLVAMLAAPAKIESFLLALASNEDAKMDKGINFIAEEWQKELVSAAEMQTLPAPIVTALQRYYQQVDEQVAKEILERYEEDLDYLDEWHEWTEIGHRSWMPNIRPNQRPTVEQQMMEDIIAMTLLLIRRIT